MRFDSILQTLTKLVLTVGGLGVIFAGVSAWVGKVLADRVYLKTHAKYEQELEALKNKYSAELAGLQSATSERRDLLNAALDAVSDAYASSHERVVQSVESVWRALLEMREFASPALMPYAVMRPEEYSSAPVRTKSLLPQGTEQQFLERVHRWSVDVEKERPFVGESVWVLYCVYLAFAMGLVWKLMKDQDSLRVRPWDEDTSGKGDVHLRSLLLNVLSESELDEIIRADRRGIPQRILGVLDGKLLGEMNKLVFGRRVVDRSLEELERVTSLMQSVDDLVRASQWH